MLSKVYRKNNLYFSCPSGAPMVQHALPIMLEHTLDNKISIERVVEKMSHAPAICFKLKNRGFIREGYYADLVDVKSNASWTVDQHNILYSCGWSPLEGVTMNFKITHTFVNGNLVYKIHCSSLALLVNLYLLLFLYYFLSVYL